MSALGQKWTTKAATNWLHVEGVAVPRNPIVGSFAGWACVASGHAAAPPTKVMNSRRLIVAPTPEDKDKPFYRFGMGDWKQLSMSALGH